MLTTEQSPQQQQPQPVDAALANRSFLYGNASAVAAAAAAAAAKRPATSAPTTSCLVGQKLVYATLDSLALRPRAASLPQSKPDLPKHDESRPAVGQLTHARHQQQQQQQSSSRKQELAGGYTFPGLVADNKQQQHKSKSKKKKKKSSGKDASDSSSGGGGGFAFAKNVLHYVPMQSRRYYRKSRKLASKSLSLKSLAGQDSSDVAGRLKSRSLSRDELKYISISAPSNFVHVDSGDRLRLAHNSGPSEYARLAGHLESSMFLLGGSFLWAGQQLCRLGEAPRADDDYDDVGPACLQASTETQECRTAQSNEIASCELVEELLEEEEEDVYDDVGPAALPEPGGQEVDLQAEEDQVYDDVGPPIQTAVAAAAVDELAREPQSPDKGDKEERGEEDEPQETYEIPQAPASLGENPEEAVELRQSCADEAGKEEEEDDVYDDVGPAAESSSLVAQATDSREAHERVNSLYSGSLQVYDKESEWEDLDEPSNVYQASNPPRGKKKSTAAARWSCKIRRQRSKASRKSSARSTSRGRTRAATAVAAGGTLAGSGSLAEAASSLDSVAVSLGTGSILVLGSEDSERHRRDEDEQRNSRGSSSCHEDEAIECKGLLQLRVVLVDDGAQVHETSLYVAEDSSDDGNYETLQTYEPDDFSSDSEAEESSGSAPSLQQQQQQQQQQQPSEQPPSRPIPPPPREESLGHTLGRRMKMLRRTWSITKGSLGRIGRRASGEVEDNGPSATAAQHDPRKYFSFKKHFRSKCQANGRGQALSTFYLDKSLSSEAGSSERESCSTGSGNESQHEPIYGNASWYKEVGLYDAAAAAAVGQRESGGFEHQLPPMDHYSVLAEEPLYQFYAADATRVAFESDSDGYEEVEELTPSSATTDLARPGHRTLWCQTPQVINSGLLQTLTAEERKIQEAKFEILTSEASYLNSLRVLENEFASNHELVHEILTPAERDKLFGSVPEVLVASERFLAELEGIWREDPMLGGLSQLLLKHADKCAGVYVDYCSNQVSIDATLKELKAKKGYRYLETLSKIEMQPACHSLSLHSFLMLPMQRITRLPLLADAVLSKLSVEHPERLSWERALSSLSQTVAKCNEGARLAERRNEMEALARKLEYPAKVPAIDLRARELIRSGTVVQLSSKPDGEYKLTFGKKFHKTPLMLMLLTDYLLVGKLKANSNEETTYSVTETCKRSLVALEAAPEEGPFSGRHAMVLTLLENQEGRQVELVLSCENDTEKERWLDAVSPPKPSCLGETLYESWDCPQVMALYSYAPRQPDEIALQPGDVINVLRKMNDGWLFGEKLLDGEQGWFPGNFTKEVASEHVRARNLRQRHRFLALGGSQLQRKARQSLSLL